MSEPQGRATTAARGGAREAVLRGTLRKRVGSRFLPFAPTRFDSDLLAAADAAAARGTPLGVLLPFPAPRAAALLGTAMLLAAVRSEGTLDVEVAVISPRMTARTIYEELAFDTQKLSDFIPRTSVGPRGEHYVVGRPKRATLGRLHFSNDLERLAGSWDRLAGLVIDARSQTPVALRRVLQGDIGARFVYLTPDPFDEGLRAVAEAGGAVCSWDQEALAFSAGPAVASRTADAGALLAEPPAIEAVARATVTVLESRVAASSELDSALERSWAALGSLSPIARSGGVGATAAVSWAWGAYAGLATCPVSPAERDRWVDGNPYALRLVDAPGIARSHARSAKPANRAAWYEVGDAFDEILRAAVGGPRFREVEAWVGAMADAGERCVVAVSGRADKAALAAALDESPSTHPDWRTVADIATRREIRNSASGPLGDTSICSPGPLPRKFAGWLAEPPGRELVVLTAGRFESRRAHAQATSARAAVRALRGAAALREGAVGFGGPAGAAGADLRGLPGPVGHAYSQAAAHRPTLTSGDLWEPFDGDVVDLLARSISVVGPGSGRRPTVADGELAHARLIRLGGPEGGVLLADPNDLVTRLRGGRLDRVAAKSVAPGDTLYLVDRGARHDLFTTIVDRLSEAAGYEALSTLVDFWHSRAARQHRSGMTYEEIHRRMIARGTGITSAQTVGTWIRGTVDGPQDPADIERFARAVGDQELWERATQIGRALSTLHTFHRQAGRWLSAQIDGARVAARDEVVDHRLGIHISDLLDTGRAYPVTAVDPSPRWVDAGLLGLVVSSDVALGASRGPGPS
jgi:hypothetical protein